MARMPEDESGSQFAPTMALPATPATLPGSSSAPPPFSAERALVGGRYELVGMLGFGGMGTVYRARDTELDEDVALKMLRRDLVAAPGILERFRREVKLARRVTHTNVARTFDIGEHEGERFLTMEFVDGESLAAVLAREGRLAPARVLEILEGLAAGLGAAHAAGVVHRDLKPDNVLIARDGRVVITDFGIARACLDAEGASKTIGTTVGTPAYMAPEQVEARPMIDARADVYALGAMLFEMLVGERAWQGESPLAVAAARLVLPPPDARSRRPKVGDAIATVLIRCMAREPAARYASVEEVRVEVNAALGGAARTAAPSISPGSTPRAVDAIYAMTGISQGQTKASTTMLAALAEMSVPRATDKGVAVLSFRNGGPPGDEYLAEGITEDLIDSLSMTPGLRVASRGAVGRSGAADRDPREIGRDLGVQVVVEGSVRRAGGALRVSARVVGVADGFQLWAKRFDRPEADALVISDEVARAVAAALTLDLKSPARQAPTDPVAIDFYLRAKAEYRKFWREHIAASIELFEQARVRAPDDPMILSGYALAAVRMWFFGGETAKSSEVLAKQAASRAVAVAPEMAEAHLAMGNFLFHDGDLKGAVREIRDAIARAPALAEARATLGRILLEIGGPEEAIPHLEAALALDPDGTSAARDLSRAYALIGELDRSDEVLEQGREREGAAGYWLNRCRTILWRRDKELCSRLLLEVPEDPVPQLMLARSVLQIVITGALPPEIEQFRPAIGRLDGGYRRRAFLYQVDAEGLALVGRIDEAIEAIRTAIEAGLIDLVWLDRCPVLDVVRARPELAPLRAILAARANDAMSAFLEPRS